MNPRFMQPTSKNNYKFHQYQGMTNTGNSKSPSNQQVAQQQAKPQPIRPLRPIVTQQQRPVQPVARKQPLPNHHSNPSATPAENSSNRRKASEPKRYTQQECITKRGNITVVDVGDYDIDPFQSTANGVQRIRIAPSSVATHQVSEVGRGITEPATPPNIKTPSPLQGSSVTSQNK